ESASGAARASTVQQYEKLGLLGSGGAAVVYLVRHLGTKELFAMKAERATKELQILQALRHPFVARLHGAFQDGANLCFVLEFCEGRTLRDVQDFCGGMFTEEEAKFYAAEVVAALEFVHAMGFVYRDLKPQNVLVQRDGHIRLADFGVAQFGDSSRDAADTYDQPIRRDANDRIRLRSNSLVGTADYMSPEMILQKPQSSDMDWWALGCLLYELLYGVGPFQARTCNPDDGAGDPAAQFRAILRCRVSFPATPK
ncbi:hypothetical protein PybrP1_002753, partial [[Pythium] brassicae (nom. inval.)]